MRFDAGSRLIANCCALNFISIPSDLMRFLKYREMLSLKYNLPYPVSVMKKILRLKLTTLNDIPIDGKSCKTMKKYFISGVAFHLGAPGDW